jgi:hypothetical protein
MSDNDTLRQAIAEEESRLARSEIPFEVDLVDKSAYSTGRKKPRRK